MEGHLEFSRLCKVNGLQVTEEQLGLLRRYVDLLLDWNSRINLISRRDEPNIWMRHVLHSVSPLFCMDFQPGIRILDLGTGGGLPGVPLAIMRTDLNVTLLDSIKKKVNAVEEMVRVIGLRNTNTVCARAGEMKIERPMDQGFDVVVARAVAPTNELIKWSNNLVRHNAQKRAQDYDQPKGLHKMSAKMPFLLAMKGGDLEDELARARVKHKNINIRCENLSIHGLRDQEFVEKKVILVEL